MPESRLASIVETRVRRPQAIAEAAIQRRRRESLIGDGERLMIIAADHLARGALRAGDRPFAMADRGELRDRLVLALSRPGVNGFLGTPEVVEELLLLGALDDKVVIGSMNRGGLAGTSFEMDDRLRLGGGRSLVGPVRHTAPKTPPSDVPGLLIGRAGPPWAHGARGSIVGGGPR